MHGGLFYFHVSKNGKPMTDEKVSAMRGKTREAFYQAVYFHFNTHKPAGVTHFQVEMNDYGSLIDFAATHRIDDFSIPDLQASVGGARYLVTFDRFINDTEENEDNDNNDNNNANNNTNGGAIRRRTVKRRSVNRRSIKRRRTRKF